VFRTATGILTAMTGYTKNVLRQGYLVRRQATVCTERCMSCLGHVHHLNWRRMRNSTVRSRFLTGPWHYRMCVHCCFVCISFSEPLGLRWNFVRIMLFATNTNPTVQCHNIVITTWRRRDLVRNNRYSCQFIWDFKLSLLWKMSKFVKIFLC
jgi:hypothetical protein